MKKEIPCSFYYYLHFMLMSMLLGENKRVLTLKEFESGMFQYRIPKQLRPVITKELEILGLVKRINKNEVEVKDSKFNPADLRKYYKLVGIY
jgi:hypothetical protein